MRTSTKSLDLLLPLLIEELIQWISGKVLCILLLSIQSEFVSDLVALDFKLQKAMDVSQTSWKMISDFKYSSPCASTL
jgi:hypothetical protein